MALKTSRPSPSELLKKSKKVRIYQIKCEVCRSAEFVTLFEGENPTGEDRIVGRSVSVLPDRCPRCGAPLKKMEFPLFTKGE